MSDKSKTLEKSRIEEVIKQASEIDIVDDTKVRNLKIKLRFEELIAQEGNTYEDVIYTLGDEYDLGYSTIKNILGKHGNYKGRKNKAV